MSSLLPPNSSGLELAIGATVERIAAVPVPVGDVWDPETCPAGLLPWLAWALSVDEWDPAWPEQTRRDVIAASLQVHMRKGTRWALRTALDAAGYAGADVFEWFEAGGSGNPYTGFVFIGVDYEGLDFATMYGKVWPIIQRTKNVRSHLDLRITLLSDPAPVVTAAASHDHDTVTVYPRAPGHVLSPQGLQVLVSGAEHLVTWLAHALGRGYNVYFSSDGGGSWSYLGGSATGQTLAAPVAIPAATGTGGKWADNVDGTYSYTGDGTGPEELSFAALGDPAGRYRLVWELVSVTAGWCRPVSGASEAVGRVDPGVYVDELDPAGAGSFAFRPDVEAELTVRVIGVQQITSATPLPVIPVPGRRLATGFAAGAVTLDGTQMAAGSAGGAPYDLDRLTYMLRIMTTETTVSAEPLLTVGSNGLFLGGGRVYIYSAENGVVDTGVFIADGRPHHLALAVDSGVAGATAVLVDGVEAWSGTYTREPLSGQNLVLGGRDGFGPGAGGTLWDVAMVAGRQADEHVAAVAGWTWPQEVTEALLGYWPCDDGGGLTLADASGQGNDLILTGAASFGPAPDGGALVDSGTGLPVPRWVDALGDSIAGLADVVGINGASVAASGAEIEITFVDQADIGIEIALSGLVVGRSYRVQIGSRVGTAAATALRAALSTGGAATLPDWTPGQAYARAFTATAADAVVRFTRGAAALDGTHYLTAVAVRQELWTTAITPPGYQLVEHDPAADSTLIEPAPPLAWTVPDLGGTEKNCLIRVESVGGDGVVLATGQSPTTFTIRQ